MMDMKERMRQMFKSGQAQRFCITLLYLLWSKNAGTIGWVALFLPTRKNRDVGAILGASEAKSLNDIFDQNSFSLRDLTSWSNQLHRSQVLEQLSIYHKLSRPCASKQYVLFQCINKSFTSTNDPACR